ncbi:hypothetical protein M413DRAFT_410766 [Hebeloma cylindrosporum]|uniref:Cytokinin riboside 5'-monophosphate phosphoribohydrolase n=1 Tax=Hebeloma cylindrosporum TaxID=76867 RepID=A0A0C3BXD2_HEBCY|nr:hypothetical protein M413DRAFT_410766 [Hebeloma cylindrosporum h7]
MTVELPPFPLPAQKPATSAIAVYCGASTGSQSAFAAAAVSLGRALADAGRTLVYGGGSNGMMGIVSGAVLSNDGKVVGVLPRAMLAGGGEGKKSGSPKICLDEAGREKVETILVDSMHERKIEMATRVDGFIGLPGGFGTFEEVLEVTTWTQLGIHDKPVALLNVLSFWEPLRALLKGSIDAGFIKPQNEQLIIFVDGPEDLKEHEDFDWGKAALEALDNWERGSTKPLFSWSHGPYGDT